MCQLRFNEAEQRIVPYCRCSLRSFELTSLFQTGISHQRNTALATVFIFFDKGRRDMLQRSVYDVIQETPEMALELRKNGSSFCTKITPFLYFYTETSVGHTHPASGSQPHTPPKKMVSFLNPCEPALPL